MSLNSRQSARLRDEIDSRRDDLAELTRALVRFPTLNPPGDHYRDICEFLRARMERSGFTVELLRAEGAPGDSDAHPRWNMIARHEGGGGTGECVHFNSHHDVVAVGEGWTRDPFGGELIDGRVYGRGSCDMKGGLATSIVAAEAFIACFPDYRGAIEVSSVADEESGGLAGAAWIAERGWFDPKRVQHVIIPEPLHKDRVCLGHRGVWWAEIETHGRIAHGCMPFLGDSAIRHMGAVLDEMERTLFPALAQRFTEMPVIPEGARQSTMNINSIHGGASEQAADYTGLPVACVADRARMIIDRRFLVEESFESVREEILDLLERVKAARPGFEYEMREMLQVLPTMAPRDAPVVQGVAAAIEEVFDRPAQFVASPGTYDQKHVDRIGGLNNCIAYGPGVLDIAHQPDEWIAVDDMVDSAKVMGLALGRLLG